MTPGELVILTAVLLSSAVIVSCLRRLSSTVRPPSAPEPEAAPAPVRTAAPETPRHPDRDTAQRHAPSHRTASSHRVPGGQGAPPAADTSATTASADRQHLLAVCMDMADRLRDGRSALFERLNQGLAEIGVRVVMPDGAPFDEREHQALGREKTADASKDMTVASTEFAGYVDADGTVLRRPQVYVYRVAGAGSAGRPQ